MLCFDVAHTCTVMQVPRAFVNLMLMLDVSKLDVFEIDPVCGNIHK